ncbi:MAG: hypothetical protein ACC645_13720, partial [Pirellulales bacterium]
GSLGVADVDLLIVHLASGQPDVNYDLTGDETVDGSDLDTWVIDLFGALPGDVTLNGRVDRGDVAAVRLGRAGAPSWGTGNVDG